MELSHPTKRRKVSADRYLSNVVVEPRTMLKAKIRGEFNFTPRVLYIFAGVHRKSSIGSILGKAGWEVIELDIARDKRHDLSLKCIRDKVLDWVRSGKFQAVITSPPCDTFSRAKFSNLEGPRPTRNSTHPRGFKWLDWRLRHKNNLGNLLADFSYEVCLEQIKHPSPGGMAIFEHPENLGTVQFGPFRGQTPASIWQWNQHAECVSLGMVSVGLRQSDFGTPYVKPTRLLLRVHTDLPRSFFPGMPEMSEDGSYAGPIPRSKGSFSLRKQKG